MKPSTFKLCAAGAALLGAACFAGYANAQTAAAPAGGPPVLATTLAPAKGGAKLTVTSPDFKTGDSLNDMFTQNGASKSPAISWSKGPAGTQSYVLLTEDAGGQRADPVIHWVVYDIPADATGLPQGVPTDAKIASPAGAMNGLNQRGEPGYRGPKPPAGQTHPYHFEVFALDTKLGLDPASANRMAVVNAMKNHVLAEGEVIANYTGK
jgi:Raf kinase inhibitor-like YbhB/YbcL family protein